MKIKGRDKVMSTVYAKKLEARTLETAYKFIRKECKSSTFNSASRFSVWKTL